MASRLLTEGTRTPPWLYAAIALGVAAGLLAVLFTSGYLLFHGLVEVFAIAVAAGMFMIAWNLRRFFDHGYLLVLSVGFFAAACVDTLHTFAYSGMGVFPDATADLPTKLWLIARYLQASALVIAPAFARRPAPPRWILGGFATATVALLSSVFVFDVFPTAFVAGTGLTPFKIYSEYAISATMLAGLLAVWVLKDTFPRDVYLLLSAAIVAAVASELAFTLYMDPYGPWNLAGHLLKIATFFLLYRAVVETSLVRPFDVLFGDLSRVTAELSESEARFRTTFERATVGIAHISLSGEWIRFNTRLASVVGYPADELEHVRPESITHPQDRPTERVLIERLLAGTIEEYRTEKRLITKDGSVVWVEASRTLLRADDDTPLYFIATFERIDERKAAEEELRRSRDLTEAVNLIDTAMNVATHVPDIARIAAEEGCRALGAESAVVLICHGETWAPVHAYRFPGEPPDDRGPWVTVTETAPLAIENAYQDAGLDATFARAWSIRALLALPLSFRGEELGVIYFVYHSAPHRFSEPELEFARKLAASVAISIDSARSYEAQRSIADALQSALLYMPESVPGLEIAHVYRSATELARIGGDFYDVFDVSNGVVAFALGDVSGKGLEASTLTAMAKSTLRAFAYHDPRPAHVLQSANAAISAQIDDSRFITVVYGTIDIGSGLLRIACAGHPAPLVCVESACIEHSIERFPPLGVVPDASFTEFEVTLTPNTLLVLFSDGLIEARNGAEFLGEERVSEIVETIAPEGTQAVVDALVAAADEHSGGRIGDDVAIVVLRYLGAGDGG